MKTLKINIGNTGFITLLVLSTFVFTTVFAQVPPAKAAKKEQVREKINAQRIAFITQQLSLTSDEAQKFWLVYNNFTKEKETLQQENPKKIAKINKNIDLLTDAQLEDFANDEIIFDQKMLDLKKKYYLEFKKVLPIKKVVKLQIAEKQFQKELLKRVKGKPVQE